jgi:hypothetical protein
MIKSGRLRWAGHIAHMGEMRIIFWLEYLNGIDHSEHLGVYGRIILEWMLEK